MKRGERISTRNRGDDQSKVREYLKVRQLVRQVKEAFAAMSPDQEAAFWQEPLIVSIVKNRPYELDRLSLENVLGRINHCPNPRVWLREFNKIKSGRLTLVEFVRAVILTRKG